VNRRSFLALAPAVLLADELPSPRRVYSFAKPVTLEATMATLKRLYSPKAVEQVFCGPRGIAMPSGSYISAVDHERGIITVTTDWIPSPKAKGWMLRGVL
jgi:hypothetical protein